MALSNIFREPRREITESVIGFSAALVFVGLDVLACLVAKRYGQIHNADEFIGGMLLIPILSIGTVVFIALFAVFTHFIGEEICRWLARHGLDPRPQIRY